MSEYLTFVVLLVFLGLGSILVPLVCLTILMTVRVWQARTPPVTIVRERGRGIDIFSPPDHSDPRAMQSDVHWDLEPREEEPTHQGLDDDERRR